MGSIGVLEDKLETITISRILRECSFEALCPYKMTRCGNWFRVPRHIGIQTRTCSYDSNCRKILPAPLPAARGQKISNIFTLFV